MATDVGRYLSASALAELFSALKAGLAAEGKELEMKTPAQGAATTVWAAIVAPGEEIGGKYCEDCHVSKIIPNDVQVGVLAEGVRAYAVDPYNAQLTWKKSEELVGEDY